MAQTMSAATRSVSFKRVVSFPSRGPQLTEFTHLAFERLSGTGAARAIDGTPIKAIRGETTIARVIRTTASGEHGGHQTESILVLTLPRTHRIHFHPRKYGRCAGCLSISVFAGGNLGVHRGKRQESEDRQDSKTP